MLIIVPIMYMMILHIDDTTRDLFYYEHVLVSIAYVWRYVLLMTYYVMLDIRYGSSWVT